MTSSTTTGPHAVVAGHIATRLNADLESIAQSCATSSHRNQRATDFIRSAAEGNERSLAKVLPTTLAMAADLLQRTADKASWSIYVDEDHISLTLPGVGEAVVFGGTDGPRIDVDLAGPGYTTGLARFETVDDFLVVLDRVLAPA